MSNYLNETIVAGGEVTTRGALVSEWQGAGVDQRYIDRWLQGFDYRPSSCANPDCYPCAFGAMELCAA